MSNLYQHRLVPAEAFDTGERDEIILYSRSIPLPSPWTAEQLVELRKIMLEEWDEIGKYWSDPRYRDYSLSRLIRELISLKGLTVEEIKALKELK